MLHWNGLFGLFSVCKRKCLARSPTSLNDSLHTVHLKSGSSAIGAAFSAPIALRCRRPLRPRPRPPRSWAAETKMFFFRSNQSKDCEGMKKSDEKTNRILRFDNSGDGWL